MIRVVLKYCKSSWNNAVALLSTVVCIFPSDGHFCYYVVFLIIAVVFVLSTTVRPYCDHGRVGVVSWYEMNPVGRTSIYDTW